MTNAWPALDLRQWRDTYETLHRWLQLVGKTRLALAPMQNHWWQVPLYVTSRGLGTSPVPSGAGTFEIELDFVDHVLTAHKNDGQTASMPLAPQSVAEFFTSYMAMLSVLDIRPRIWPVPVELNDVIPFAKDYAHNAYDPDAAHRCWLILVQVDRLLKEFRGPFIGKCSPAHFWWGAFDISCTRFSGRTAPPHTGGAPNVPKYVNVEAYSHECISAGWWPGSVDGPVNEAAFYAYSYPEPAGCATAPIRPREAYYHTDMGEWILPYRLVRESPNPDETVLSFFSSTYETAANLGGWNRKALER